MENRYFVLNENTLGYLVRGHNDAAMPFVTLCVMAVKVDKGGDPLLLDRTTIAHKDKSRPATWEDFKEFGLYTGRTPDLTREEIAKLRPMKAPGLYFLYNGEKRTPYGLYFSSDLREYWNNPEEYAGRLYTHFDNALRPVFNEDGEQYEWPGLACVNAHYKDGMICDYYKG